MSPAPGGGAGCVGKGAGPSILSPTCNCGAKSQVMMVPGPQGKVGPGAWSLERGAEIWGEGRGVRGGQRYGERGGG